MSCKKNLNLIMLALGSILILFACKDNSQDPTPTNQRSLIGTWKLDSTIVNSPPYKVDTSFNYTLIIENDMKYKKISNINTIMLYGTVSINADTTVLEFNSSINTKTSNVIKVFNESTLHLEHSSDGYLFKEYFSKR